MALKNGSRGSDVTALQEQLRANGYDIASDGIYGPKTEAAVRDYQAKNGLSVDGIVGSETSGSLNGTQAPVQNEATLGVTERQIPRARSNFETSERTNRYQSLLDDYDANKPDPYQSQYGGQIDNILNLIKNRTPFDINTDVNYKALYDSYAPIYQKQADRSMKNAMGTAAGLTGGYASSYSQSAGQQAYDATMDQLNARKMELANLAYQMYQDEGSDLYNRLGTYQGLENDAYGKYRDSYSDWANERNYYAGLYDQSYANDRAEWEADRDYTDSVFESAMALAQAGYDIPDSYTRWLDDDQLSDLNAARAYSQAAAAPSYSGGSSGSSGKTQTKKQKTVADYDYGDDEPDTWAKNLYTYNELDKMMLGGITNEEMKEVLAELPKNVANTYKQSRGIK